MSELENAKKSLDSALSTISNCDNKANSFLTAVGIIFGFSMFSVRELSDKAGTIKTLVIIFGILYLFSFIFTIIILVLIVFPRRRNKGEKNRQIDYQYYSEDMFGHLKTNSIDSFITKDITIEAVVEQVRACVRIAHKKETLLRVATLSIIVFALFLVCIVVCIFI